MRVALTLFKQFMKKLLPCLLILCLLPYACTHSNEPASAGQKTRQDSLALKVALMPTLDCLPFYYAQQCGIYTQLGLDVRLKSYKAQMDCDTAFSRRHVDVSYTDLVRASLLQSKGTGLYAIMQTDGYHELVTFKSKRMRNTKHLKERMVGIARHSVTDLLLDTVTREARLDPSTVYHPQINDITLRGDMLNNGTLDAAFLPEPYATQAKAAGHKSIFHSQKKQIQLMALIASYQSVHSQRKAEQLRLLIKGYNLATEAINKKENYDSIQNILRNYPLRQSTIDTLKLPQYSIARKVEQPQVNTAVNFLRGRNLLSNGYTGDTLINTLFIQ